MSTFTSTSVQRTAADPTKHVNYVLGMVLGVDDFTQEFAYLSERDRWLARDLLGYGTAWGLAVTHGTGTKGPEARVSSGVALTPRGQLVRVVPAQCAALNDWLAAQGTAVDAKLRAGNRVWAYVVLRHRSCLTDPVPVPGEPCRTEDDTTAPSRVTDDFLLELKLEPPPVPQEEHAVRDFVRWLRQHMNVVPASDAPTSLPTFLAAIRAAVVPTASPPADDYMQDTSPATPLTVLAMDVEYYLRAALRIWVTELRGLWRTHWLGEAQGCTQPVTPAPESDADSVLLAALDLPLVREMGTGPWKINSASNIVVDEDKRPYLLHQRFMQEWALAGMNRSSTAVHHPAGLPGYSIVAAGVIPADEGATVTDSYNGLRVRQVKDGYVTLGFDGYQHLPTLWRYVVKAMLVEPDEGVVTQPTVTFVRADVDGLWLRLRDKDALMLAGSIRKLGLTVEVSQFPVGAGSGLKALNKTVTGTTLRTGTVR